VAIAPDALPAIAYPSAHAGGLHRRETPSNIVGRHSGPRRNASVQGPSGRKSTGLVGPSQSMHFGHRFGGFSLIPGEVTADCCGCLSGNSHR